MTKRELIEELVSQLTDLEACVLSIMEHAPSDCTYFSRKVFYDLIKKSAVTNKKARAWLEEHQNEAPTD